MPPHFNAEREILARGFTFVAGVDEAGRGPLAGPVAAAAVILDPDALPEGLDDSKVLSAPRRLELYGTILLRARAVGVGLASVGARACYALVDGSDHPPRLPCPGHAIVKGDGSSLSIAAASIVAKVTRDRLMERLDREHPHYGFGSHKGYATAAHRSSLVRHGPSPFHRSAFFSVREALAVGAGRGPGVEEA